MTFHTKAATDEIYEMFNQPLKDEEDDSDSTDYSDNSNDSNDQEDESLPDYSYEQDNEEEREEELGMSDLTQNTGQLSVNSRPVSQELSNTTFTPVREQKHDIRALSTMTPISETSEAPSQNPEVVRKEIINPMDFGVRQKILLSSSQRSFLESQHKFFYYDMKFEMEQKLKRTILQANRNQAPSNALITFPNGYPSFKFLKIIGEGGFGSVFLVESQDNFLKACKVERTKLPWEYYMLKKVEGRLKDTRALESIMTIDEIHSFEDEQYLFQQFLPYGTMIDAVNYWKEEHEGKSFDELTAMYFTVEILRSMETLHSNGIIHGDIKPDNFMIRYDSSITLENRNYNRLGQAGWDSQGIKLIDFGRAIDMKLFPSDVQFIANWKMDQQDCVEMQKQQTWTYQADYHGIAAIIYLMLFGEFIKLAEDREGNVSVFRISNSLKRYWQKDIWNELFTILLNSALVAEQSEVKLPLTPLLSSCREKFEDYLEQHSEGGNSSLYDSLNWLHEGLAKRFKHISNDLF